jgi:pSer/pThr/pTyr-binding forkhead associated (FHA) protein
MRSLEQIDRWIAGKVKRWTSRFSGVPGAKEVLEIRRDILEDVRDKIKPVGKGKTLFRYDSVAIRIGAKNSEEQELRQAALAESGDLERDMAALLTEAGCPIPAGFAVAVEVVEDAELAAAARPFHIDYASRKGPPKPAAGTARPAIKLTVVRGDAESTEYVIAVERVNIGRLKEVVGERDGLRRRNDIAFKETETTVSREHAYIRYDADSGKFRVYDSGSQRGTSIFRAGRRLEVPRGPTRGVQLQPGDEIHLGEARLGFDVVP